MTPRWSCCTACTRPRRTRSCTRPSAAPELVLERALLGRMDLAVLSYCVRCCPVPGRRCGWSAADWSRCAGEEEEGA